MAVYKPDEPFVTAKRIFRILLLLIESPYVNSLYTWHQSAFPCPPHVLASLVQNSALCTELCHDGPGRGHGGRGSESTHSESSAHAWRLGAPVCRFSEPVGRLREVLGVPWVGIGSRWGCLWGLCSTPMGPQVGQRDALGRLGSPWRPLGTLFDAQWVEGRQSTYFPSPSGWRRCLRLVRLVRVPRGQRRQKYVFPRPPWVARVSATCATC